MGRYRRAEQAEGVSKCVEVLAMNFAGLDASAVAPSGSHEIENVNLN